jgi:hypothetical protein
VPDDAAAELAFLLSKVSDISDSYESATERISSNDEKVSRSACATQSASSCYSCRRTCKCVRAEPCSCEARFARHTAISRSTRGIILNRAVYFLDTAYTTNFTILRIYRYYTDIIIRVYILYTAICQPYS